MMARVVVPEATSSFHRQPTGLREPSTSLVVLLFLYLTIPKALGDQFCKRKMRVRKVVVIMIIT
jgi:hypothetical protein